ncbi:hypothetical protein, partial [Metapseudomonas otitidis]|uniref:hypothetical protein n=1 Tax=Metapseudomonas otitidis TaxID=319939 RepID=UPI001980263E
IQIFKERFDQVFRLNRGRAFYSSLSFCQAVFRRIFSFYSTTCASFDFSSEARRAFYSTSFFRQAVFRNFPFYSTT